MLFLSKMQINLRLINFVAITTLLFSWPCRRLFLYMGKYHKGQEFVDIQAITLKLKIFFKDTDLCPNLEIKVAITHFVFFNFSFINIIGYLHTMFVIINTIGFLTLLVCMVKINLIVFVLCMNMFGIPLPRLCGRSFRSRSGLHRCNTDNYTDEDLCRLQAYTDRKLAIQNKRDVSTNTKQLYSVSACNQTRNSYKKDLLRQS